MSLSMSLEKSIQVSNDEGGFGVMNNAIPKKISASLFGCKINRFGFKILLHQKYVNFKNKTCRNYIDMHMKFSNEI